MSQSGEFRFPFPSGRSSARRKYYCFLNIIHGLQTLNISGLGTYPGFELPTISARLARNAGADDALSERKSLSAAGNDAPTRSSEEPRSVEPAVRNKGTPDSTSLSSEQQRALIQLQVSDRRVRAHEQAHLSAAGALAQGGTSYSYATGPDGELYVVAGEVQIDSAPIPGNPEATVMKMEQVVRAALAPVDPSSQDLAVAADAAAKAARAESQKQCQFRRAGDNADPSFIASGNYSGNPSPLRNILNLYQRLALGDFVHGATLSVTR